MDKEGRIESSVPVQGRVSVVTLAELEMFWAEQGVRIKSLSQLLSFSVEAFRGLMADNDKLPKIIESVTEAHRYLEVLGLYQPGLKNRSMKKILNAIKFENLRADGIDPKNYVNQQYNTVHRTNTQDMPEQRLSGEEVRARARREKYKDSVISDEEYERIQSRIREEKAKEIEKAKQDNVRMMKEIGMVVDDTGIVLKEGITYEDLNKERAERDRKRIELENSAMPVATAGKE